MVATLQTTFPNTFSSIEIPLFSLTVPSPEWHDTRGHTQIRLSSWKSQIIPNCPFLISLQCRHNEPNGVSNQQPQDCLLNRLFRRWSKKTSKLCITGLCVGKSPTSGEFPAQRASNAENVSIWWRHHVNGQWPSSDNFQRNVNQQNAPSNENWDQNTMLDLSEWMDKWLTEWLINILVDRSIFSLLHCLILIGWDGD